MKYIQIAASLSLVGVVFAGNAFAAEPTVEQKIEILQQEIEALQAQLAKLTAAQSANSAAPGAASQTSASPPANTAPDGSTVGAAATTGLVEGVTGASGSNTLGGYGEISYNNYRKDSGRNQADLKRFVLFFGHRFDDRLSFNSEVEWEHAVTSSTDQGESEIEQAYLNYRLGDNLSLKAGLFLMPFGFINESHEPPVFYGVERNEVETRIIPSTWREGGVGIYGATDGGFGWDIGITTGFDGAKFDDPSHPLHSVHQELQFAKAHDPSLYAAVNYRGVPGLTLGGAIFSGNSLQGNADFRADPTLPNFAGIAGRVTLGDLHGRWQHDGWDLQAVYARGRIADAERIDAVLQAFNVANGSHRPYVPGEFYGWLTQGAYTLWQRGEMSLTPFARYEKFNTQASMPNGIAADPANADRVFTLGLSFKPLTQVVFKADYQKFRDNPDNDRFNLGLGYMF